jgi:hypothetical protein
MKEVRAWRVAFQEPNYGLLTVLSIDVKSMRGLARTDFSSWGARQATSYTRRAPAPREAVAADAMTRLAVDR